MFGYKCNLQTDTEVITYIMDYLIRRQGLTLEEAAAVVSASFWSTIEKKSPDIKEKETFLRTVFPSLLITGPFSIVFGFNGGLMALNDRLKLRSMVVGEKDDKVFIASEEAAIRVMEPDAENIWAPAGGEPVIVKVKEGTFKWAWNSLTLNLRSAETTVDALHVGSVSGSVPMRCIPLIRSGG